jgi:hypothetical protein
MPKVPGALTVNCAPSASALPPLAFSVPLLIVQPSPVASVPVRVKVPDPFLVRLSKLLIVLILSVPAPVPFRMNASVPAPPLILPETALPVNRVTVSLPLPAVSPPFSVPART